MLELYLSNRQGDDGVAAQLCVCHQQLSYSYENLKDLFSNITVLFTIWSSSLL